MRPERVAATVRPAHAGARRVLLVEHSETGHVGGSLTGLLHLIRALDTERWDPSLLLYEPKGLDGLIDPARVIVLPGDPHAIRAVRRGFDTRTGRLADMRRAVGAVRRFVQQVLPKARVLLPVFREARPDVIHLGNGIKPNLDGVVAARWAGIPCIAHEKGLVRYTPFDRLWARAVDACVCMTDVVRRHLVAQGVRGCRMPVVHDGIDLSGFEPRRPRDAVRAELGLAPDALAIGMTVNIQPWKGQDVTLRAFAELAAEFPTLVCVLAGGVVRGTEEFMAGLDAFVRERGLADRVRFLGHRNDVPDVVAALDVVVHASVTPEPFGRVLIEAMGLAKPLVAIAEGGVPEIVDDGKTGFLVPARDHDAMARALRPLLQSADLRASMGERGRRRVREHFSVDGFARAMEAVYAEVLGG